MNTLKTNTVRTLLIAVCGAVCLTFGCAKQQQAKRVEQICTANLGRAEAMKIAEDVLSRLHFTVAKADAESGIITTKPLAGGQFFEFWRKDTSGRVQSLESSIHTIRRRGTVSISPKGEGSQVFVKVVKERKCAPGTSPDTLGETFNIFDTEDTDLMRQNQLDPTDYEWVDMGRDDLLEQDILERILINLK